MNISILILFDSPNSPPPKKIKFFLSCGIWNSSSVSSISFSDNLFEKTGFIGIPVTCICESLIFFSIKAFFISSVGTKKYFRYSGRTYQSPCGSKSVKIFEIGTCILPFLAMWAHIIAGKGWVHIIWSGSTCLITLYNLILYHLKVCLKTISVTLLSLFALL